MTDLSIPDGFDVYWEKWSDAFETYDDKYIDDQIAEMERGENADPFSDENNVFEEPEFDDHEPDPEGLEERIKSIVTPFGILPLTEQSRASTHFKLWVGHTNFKLTEEFFDIIGTAPGVETLDFLSPYRFRIAVGKLFLDRTVMKRVRDTMVDYVTEKNHE